MENQVSSANTEVSFDVTEITADDIDMEDISTQQRWQGQSSDMTEKASGMNKSQITALALNLLSTDSMIRSTGIHIPEMKPCIICKQKFISHPDEPIKEFTMATCGCLYHQKCLEGYFLNIAKTRAKLTCPNWDCKGREIETLITQDLFKETGKPTSSTADVTKPVDSGNQTPVDDVALMDELGLLDGKEQSSSKTTDVAKETSDQATIPIEVVSTTPGNSENVDDSISKKLSSGKIQHPICEKCSEEISLEFSKDTVFLSCKHAVHYDCIDDPCKRCPTCPSPEVSDTQKKRTRESSASTEKSSNKKAKKTGGKKVSSTLKQLIKELLTDIPDGDRSLDETSESADNFLQLSERIDRAETKNEEASRGLISVILILGKLYLNDTRN